MYHGLIKSLLGFVHACMCVWGGSGPALLEDLLVQSHRISCIELVASERVGVLMMYVWLSFTSFARRVSWTHAAC